MSLLKPLDEFDENSISLTIKRKLSSQGISDVRMLPEIPGPVVTGYPLRVSVTPIAKIYAKAEDIALALKVESVDIQRIGGEIVIFVPNTERRIVDFKENLFWYLQDEAVREMQIPIPLGMDFRGNKTAIDLATAPHILIAGSTGSGKSIFESSIIACLSMLFSEEELHIHLVDTKRTDLVHFSELPQVSNIITNIQQWENGIQNLIQEVDFRTGLFARMGVRNIKEHNERVSSKMPYVILMIDEFADLLVRGKEVGVKVDLAVGRLTQISRAAGIHVILCTQRSSTKVVYGDLKANFPTRIALKLPSNVDSRTILDEGGAENLLGKGDMLVKTQDSDELRRFHAPFVRLEDIDAVLNHRDMILTTINRPRLSS